MKTFLRKIYRFFEKWFNRPEEANENDAAQKQAPPSEPERISIEEHLAIAERIRQENLVKEKQERSAIIKPSEHEFCSKCNKNHVELLICCKCGAKICGDCATENFSGEIYCDECFESDVPATPAFKL